MVSIGQRIKMARERKHMTLDEVAKKCHTTKQTIFKYESEIVTNIPYDKIELLAQALDVSPSYLFGWDEKESVPGKVNLTEDELRILTAFREMSPERQKALADLLGISDPQK